MPIFFVLWIGSVARVALGIAHQETFGAEGALALLAVLVVPYLSTDAIVWALRRCFVPRTRRR